MLGIDTVPRRSTTCPTARPTSSSCARPPPPTSTCCGRARRRASGPRSSRRPATARRARTGRRRRGRAGRAGRRARHPARGPERPGRRLDAGVSCARRSWRPYPPPGGIGIASQSGNFVSSFLNYAVQTGVGVSRAVSAGNAAAVTVADYLEYYADDPATDRRRSPTSRASPTGAASSSGCAASPRRKPLVAGEGRRDRRRAAGRGRPHRRAGHRRPGLRRHVPPGRHRPGRPRSRRRSRRRPRSPPSRSRAGPRVVVLTTAGGWGVVTADAIAARRPRAARACPTTCAPPSTSKLPPRWSRNNPVDLAGGETRDTIPEVHGAHRRATPTSTRSSTSASASSRTRRALMRDGPVLPRPRPRADRRLPRAPGRPLRGGRGRDLATRPASRSSPPPSWRSPIPTTPARARSGRPGGSATRPRNRAVTALGHL